VEAFGNGMDGTPAIYNVPVKNCSTDVAALNPGINNGYRCRFVARLEPESPNPLAHKAKKNNAHANEKHAYGFISTHKYLFILAFLSGHVRRNPGGIQHDL